MFQDFPIGHPFASCANPSLPTTTQSSLPNITGPVPPRRHQRPHPTPVQQSSHSRSGSSSSTSSSSTPENYLLLTPTSSRSTTPTTVLPDSESEKEFFERLSTTSKLFGTSSSSSRRSSQSSLSEDFETFVAGVQRVKVQFGSTGRRGGADLRARQERAARLLESEVEEAELHYAVRAIRAECVARVV